MIDPRTLQTFLKTGGYYSGQVDGIFGPASTGAGRAALKAANVNAGAWSNARVLVGVEQLFLNKVMGAGLIVDGISGPRTEDAIYDYNKTELRPVTNSWPRQRDVAAFYGSVGRNQVMVQCPYTMFGDYDRKIKVTQFSAHKKVAASLERILSRALAHYGATQIRKLNLDIFSGCLNVRKIAGSTNWSMHAWGIAIDIDAAHNQMDEGRTAAFAKPVYAPFLDFFEDEGWTSLGRARNYDYMHFQAARL